MFQQNKENSYRMSQKVEFPWEMLQEQMALVNFGCAEIGKNVDLGCFYSVEIKEIAELNIPSKEDEKKVIQKAYEDYSKKHNPRGTIDIAYEKYGHLYFMHLRKGNLKIPNGCCNIPKCYINQFFEVLTENIRK